MKPKEDREVTSMDYAAMKSQALCSLGRDQAVCPMSHERAVMTQELKAQVIPFYGP